MVDKYFSVELRIGVHGIPINQEKDHGHENGIYTDLHFLSIIQIIKISSLLYLCNFNKNIFIHMILIQFQFLRKFNFFNI